jgi:ParB-like chromosome segregation protein Spo0J
MKSTPKAPAASADSPLTAAPANAGDSTRERSGAGVSASGSTGMQIEMWPIGRPIPYARNARKLSARAIDTVAASLVEFGWQQPIVVDSRGVVVAGHTRLLAAKKLEMAEVPVHVAANLTPGQIKAYRLMDNRAHDESGWDESLLGPELMDLKSTDFELKLTGFGSDAISKLFATTGDGWDDALGLAAGALETETDQTPDTSAKLGGMEYRVVVDCADEMQQTELLDRFAGEGLKARALIS